MIRGMALLIAGGVALSGCAARHDEAWLQTLRGREAPSRGLQRVAAKGGAFTSQVSASARGSIESGEEVDYLALDIGSDSPIECALYHDEVEAASTLRAMAAQVFTDLEERHGAAIERDPFEIDAGVIAGSPYLRLTWSYRTAVVQGQVFGQLKQMIATREGRSVYCVHNENGFHHSFDRVFRELIENMRFSSYDQMRPYFTQIDVISTGGERIGYRALALTLDEDGEPRVVRYTTLLRRDAEGAIAARDVTAVEHSTLQGELRGQLFTDFRDGDVSSSLVLEDLAGVGWQVRGQRDGANLRAIFEQQGLVSWLGETRSLRGLVTAPSDVGEIRADLWEPEYAAERSVERRYRRVGRLAADRWSVAVRTGERQAALAVDADGLVQSSVSGEGGSELVLERAFVDGALR